MSVAARKRKTTSISSGGRGFLRSGGNYKFQPGLGPELKWKDTNISFKGLLPNWTPTVESINLLKSGTGPNELVGRKMVIKSVQIRGHIMRPSIAVQPGWDDGELPEEKYNEAGRVIENFKLPGASCHNYVRIAVVLDRQANGQFPSGKDVWQAPEGKDYATERAFLNLSNSGRFHILKQIVVKCPVPAAVPVYSVGRAPVPNPDPEQPPIDAGGPELTFLVQPEGVYDIPTIDLKTNIPVEFSPNVADAKIGNIRSNNILVFACVGNLETTEADDEFPERPGGGGAGIFEDIPAIDWRIVANARIRYSDA